MRSPICAAAAALFFALSAHAQNKCVDEKGKVTYQQDPCPGTVRAAPPKPPAATRPAVPPSSAPAVAPARAAAPSAPAYSGRSSKELWAEYAEMERCYGDWDNYVGTLQRNRDNVNSQRAQGRDTARSEMMNQQQIQNYMSRFLPMCGKYGFEQPRDQAIEQRNTSIARGLENKMPAKRAEIDVAMQSEQSQRDAPQREREAQQRAAEEASDRRQCDTAARQIAEARAARPQIPAAQLAKFDQDLAKAEREVNQNCQRR
jgi:hypothetical protein